MANIRDISSGKTSQEHSAATEERISTPSSQQSAPSKKPMRYQYLCRKTTSGSAAEKSWEIIILSPGDCLTHNTGESPNVVVESTLSQILEEKVPAKYYLSPKACLGIIKRSMKRGKGLPFVLLEALKKQAGLT